jgi:hypothetical protein
MGLAAAFQLSLSVWLAVNDDAGATLSAGGEDLLSICGQHKKPKTGSMTSRAMPQMKI